MKRMAIFLALSLFLALISAGCVESEDESLSSDVIELDMVPQEEGILYADPNLGHSNITTSDPNLRVMRVEMTDNRKNNTDPDNWTIDIQVKNVGDYPLYVGNSVEFLDDYRTYDYNSRILQSGEDRWLIPIMGEYHDFYNIGDILIVGHQTTETDVSPSLSHFFDPSGFVNIQLINSGGLGERHEIVAVNVHSVQFVDDDTTGKSSIFLEVSSDEDLQGVSFDLQGLFSSSPDEVYADLKAGEIRRLEFPLSYYEPQELRYIEIRTI